MTAAVLDVRELAVARGAALRVELGRLALAPGALAALVGPSGCGKSTVLDMLGLILAPDHVERYVLRVRDGASIDVAPMLARGDIDAMAPLRRAHFGFVLQTGGLLPFLSARENILMAGGDPADVAANAGRLGLGDLLERLPGAMSVGQRQRVCVARALQARPAVVLADEPTASLDPILAAETLALFVEIARSRGSAVLVASHDWDLVARLGFRRIAGHTRRDGAGAVTRFDAELAA